MFYLNGGTHSIGVTHSTRNFITVSAEQEKHVIDPLYW